MLRSWIQLIVIALLCFILYIYTKAYMALITLIILSFLVFTSGAALLWVRRKIQVTLTSGWPAYKGETGKILLKVQNTGIFPVTYITCQLLFYNKLTKQYITKDVYLQVKGKDDIEVPLHYISDQIGKIEISIKAMKVYDYLRLFSLPVSGDSSLVTYILPHQIPIDMAVQQKPAGPDGGEHHVDTKAFLGSDPTGIKEYEVGDNVRDMHWKLTSKFQYPIIKEYSVVPDERILLFYDTFHTGRPEEINTRMEVFLSLSGALIEQGHEHTLGWLVDGGRDLKFKDIHTQEELVVHQGSILEMDHQHQAEIPIHDMVDSLARLYSHIYIVTTEANPDIKGCYGNAQVTVMTYSAIKREKDGRHVSFTRDTLQDDLRYLTV